MAAIKGICFDLFNTLVSVGRVPEHVGEPTADVLGVDAEVWRKVCFGEQHDICQPTDAFDNLSRMAHSIDPAIPESLIQQAVTIRQRRFDYALLHVEDEVLDTLADMRYRGIRLALVSNASTAEVTAWSQSPLAPLFDTAIFSCHCGSKKPEPGIYQQALAELALLPGTCLFVGDGGSNEHHGAHAVGMKPVLLRQYLHAGQKQELERELSKILIGAVDALAELPDLLDKV